MAAFVDQLTQNMGPGQAVPFNMVLILLAHSTVLGLILVLTTTFIADGLNFSSGKNSGKETSREKQAQKIIGVANQLFLCVGLTGVMLMVNNNLVRAFAIAAAIALVRFRVRLDKKSLNSSLLFAVLAGMACGLNELVIAWTSTGVYVLLLIIMSVVIKLSTRKYATKLEIKSRAP
jgi:hypothetical protein